MPDLTQRLIEAMTEMPVIDAHEHLPPEAERVARDVDVFTLFGHYTHNDLISAGMTREQYDWLQDPSQDLDERWRVLEPFYARTRHTSYVRAARLAAQRFYELDIAADTYAEITERMKAANTPGIYERVLADACNIRVALTQVGRVVDDELLIAVLPLASLTANGNLGGLRANAERVGVELRGLDDCDALMEAVIAEHKRSGGVVGYKHVSTDLTTPDRATAAREFGAMLAGQEYDGRAVSDWLTHRALDLAGDAGLPVAVHCGIIWDNWNDFYDRHPRYMIPTALAHRGTRFDLYHAGIPWVREVGVMAKELPNCWLNLCWCHIISQRMSVSALDEWLDMVPLSKIIGFGGDYNKPVEKVYGHLVMAREDIAEVLAGRVERGTMRYGEALEAARMMLFDNPRELYGLEL